MNGARGSHSPPRLSRLLVSSVLPPGVRREAILGDLEEEFCAAAARGSLRGARAWYRRQSFRLATRYALTRAGSRLPSGPGLGRPAPPLRTIGEDLRYAARGLAKSPGFAAAAIITLALGIGANTAVFSVVNAVLLRNLPFEHPERVVQMWASPPPDRLGTEWPMAQANVEELQSKSEVFEHFAAIRRDGYYTWGSERIEIVEALQLSSDYFAMTGVETLLGRTLMPEDYGRAVALLSYGYWQRELGGTDDVLDKPLVLLQMAENPAFEPGKSERWTYLPRELDIVGVLPASFELPPLRLQAEYRVWLRPDLVVPHADQLYPPPGAQRRRYLSDRVLAQLREGATGLVLLIACANLPSLLFGRAIVRQQEMALRAALGAGRLRLLRLLLVESVLLGLLACGLGLPGQSPLGKVFYQGNQDPAVVEATLGKVRRSPQWDRMFPPPLRQTVIGVVTDVKSTGLEHEPVPQYYAVHWMNPQALRFMVRTSSDPARLAESVRQAIEETDPELTVTDIRTMDTVYSDATAESRFRALLAGLFAALAALLTTLGLFGVLAYAVSQRTHEIGVRMSLGARSHDISTLILRQGLRLIASGMAIGVAVALLSTRYVASLLFEVSPTDPTTLASVCSLIALLALAACYLPVRRATLVDPMRVLRQD